MFLARCRESSQELQELQELFSEAEDGKWRDFGGNNASEGEKDGKT
jgi:hypothetical protein